ncbi:hypothetical protein GCK72_015774 [Caenorhabditis remanei]|uniref:Uncharacterized protein n=1 Tax=Caenorhabditis remanei TaxID=31234 RepID=A0A6A5GXH7_CAERE|nr:hypothetical protein GCK72_015774 [Caenorhabditis remanei]KAF1759309.1 hypothetical protein GCK72_015774 [Caenorhabditis remanei]
MNELEVLEEWKDQQDEEKYNRLATDAIQLDLTAKFSRNLVQRQEKNALKLFDNCKNRPDNCTSTDPLLELARSSIDQIKRLYLEEISTDAGATVTLQFGKGVNPILDSCWSLIPIRRVLDTVEKGRSQGVTPDDVEIVRLAILWTLLLFSERKSAFFAFSQPDVFYIHLTETLMIGSEILMDDVICRCLQRLLTEYLIPQATEGRISVRMSGKSPDWIRLCRFTSNY